MAGKRYGKGKAARRRQRSQRIEAYRDVILTAIESQVEGWVAIGTQFHPEAESASALDVKIFEEFVIGITGEVPEMRLVA
jgi:hypothetical protein